MVNPFGLWRGEFGDLRINMVFGLSCPGKCAKSRIRTVRLGCDGLPAFTQSDMYRP